MARQDEKSLYQREHQRQRNHHRQLPRELRSDTRNKQPGRKRHNGRQHRKNHWPADGKSARDGSVFAGQATLMHVMMDTFSHHDRVVDHDPQNQQKGEGRQQIQRHIISGQQSKGTEETNADTHRHP